MPLRRAIAAAILLAGATALTLAPTTGHLAAQLFGHRFQPVACRGDHSLCGCSHTRIAAHNCCCAQRQRNLDRAREAGRDRGGAADTVASGPHGASAAEAAWCALPCGEGPSVPDPSWDSVALVPPRLPLRATMDRPPTAFPENERLQGRPATEPPVPPPKPKTPRPIG